MGRSVTDRAKIRKLYPLALGRGGLGGTRRRECARLNYLTEMDEVRASEGRGCDQSGKLSQITIQVVEELAVASMLPRV
jgi:hypothetical protein